MKECFQVHMIKGYLKTNSIPAWWTRWKEGSDWKRKGELPRTSGRSFPKQLVVKTLVLKMAQARARMWH